MSSSLYYLLCLAGGLLAIAAASAMIVWRQRATAMRQLHAIELLDLLARYSDWFGAQRHAVCFQAPAASAPAVESIAAALEGWGALPCDAQALLQLHGRLYSLLSLHAMQCATDPEGALEADHDAAFAALWREHCQVVHVLERELRAVASAAPALSGLTLPS